MAPETIKTDNEIMVTVVTGPCESTRIVDCAKFLFQTPMLDTNPLESVCLVADVFELGHQRTSSAHAAAACRCRKGWARIPTVMPSGSPSMSTQRGSKPERSYAYLPNVIPIITKSPRTGHRGPRLIATHRSVSGPHVTRSCLACAEWQNRMCRLEVLSISQFV